jgi:hypothetical protein
MVEARTPRKIGMTRGHVNLNLGRRAPALPSFIDQCVRWLAKGGGAAASLLKKRPQVPWQRTGRP